MNSIYLIVVHQDIFKSNLEFHSYIEYDTEIIMFLASFEDTVKDISYFILKLWQDASAGCTYLLILFLSIFCFFLFLFFPCCLGLPVCFVYIDIFLCYVFFMLLFACFVFDE